MKAITATAGSRAVSSDRVVGFDLLRGVCAIAVAAYHVLAWNDWAHIYTWGTYAVYIFFVLSGASMWIAYADRFAAGFSPARFLGLRLVRLLPLYLLALLYGLVIQLRAYGHVEDPGQAFLNLAFQFGLGNPADSSGVVGGWSIGIEFAFYLVFPALLAVISGRWWWAVLLVAFASQHVFIARALADSVSLTESFAGYTQPLAFAFYFVAGCVIGRAILSAKLRAHWLGAPIVVGSLAVVTLMSGDAEHMTLIGAPGLMLSLLTVLAVAAAAAWQIGPAGGWIAEQLGKASYGIYILHPFMREPAAWISKTAGLGPAGVLVLTVLGSLFLALLLNRWYEQPVQAFFKRR